MEQIKPLSDEVHLDSSRQLIIEHFLDSAVRHQDTSGGDLQKLDFDPDAYLGQGWQDYYIAGHVSGASEHLEAAFQMAVDFRPHIAEAADALLEQNINDGRLTQLGTTLSQGKSVFLAGLHGSGLVEPAEELAAVAGALHRLGYEGFMPGVFVGKLLPFIGMEYNGELTPSVSLISGITKDLYITYPVSASNKNLWDNEQVAELMTRHNAKASAKCLRSLGRQAGLIDLQLNGKTNQPSQEDPETIVVGRTAKETAELLVRAGRRGALVMGITTWMSAEKPRIELSTDLVSPEDTSEIYEISEIIFNRLDATVESLNFRLDGANPGEQTLGRAAVLAATA